MNVEPIPLKPATTRWRWVVCIAGLGVLASATYWWVAGPRHDMTGLEGIWRDPVNPKHSHRFGAFGQMESWWDNLPHGVVGSWSRNGQTIRFRAASDFRQMDDMNGKLQIGIIDWQTGDGRKVAWKRE